MPLDDFTKRLMEGTIVKKTEFAELPKGKVITRDELEALGLYDTSKKIGSAKQTVYWGPGQGVCILDPTEDPNTYTVYSYTRSEVNRTQ